MPRESNLGSESGCPKLNVFIVLALLTAFTIGLNIGLHGGISLHLDAKKFLGGPLIHRLNIPEAKTTAPKIEQAAVEQAAVAPPLVPTTPLATIASSEQPPAIVVDNAAAPAVPILLMTCNRPEMLDNTIKSLLSVRGVRKDIIMVSQDGAMQQIKDVVEGHGLPLVQNHNGLRLRGGAGDGASRIAMHYKFSLTAIFDRLPNATAVIIVEDDLLFSPDFYEYFNAVAPILSEDPTTFVVSAWNDNGFKSKINDPLALRRTEFFPGLGWLLTRHLYKTELESKWPRTHWDHWLRSPAQHKNREIIYPQVPL